MNLRNLKIFENNIQNKNDIIDGIIELDNVIMDNYQIIKEKEIGIEFNIGSRLGEPREYLVVYSNPDYKNNPYVFILKQTEEGRKLVKETDLFTFVDLADLDIRREINKTLVIGFNNLPKYAFLGKQQIEDARNLANDYDFDER